MKHVLLTVALVLCMAASPSVARRSELLEIPEMEPVLRRLG